ncbi:hypothetical protein TNCV_3035211 [Trichonephila clavipes]|nr:hypothetical protein TNCV_3035211 [Trichonephila clavipes]
MGCVAFLWRQESITGEIPTSIPEGNSTIPSLGLEPDPTWLQAEEPPRPTTSVLLAPCHDEFHGPQSDYIKQVALATTTNRVSYPPYWLDD